jgi:hypothetical protein
MRSGKSNLIAWLLEDCTSVVIVDSKRHPEEWGAWGPRHGYLVTGEEEAISRAHKVVWQVDMTALLDINGWRRPGHPGYRWTDGLQRIMRRGKTVVVFDELVHVLPANRQHPAAIQILTQGAAWKLSAWGGSQYANRVETMIVRGAVHCYAFQLAPIDRELMERGRGLNCDVLGNLSPDPAKPNYRFGYHLTNTPDWIVCGAAEKVM